MVVESEIPDEQARRRLRLAAAVKEVFAGNETEMARALGFKDGAFLRQMMTGRRQITEKTVAKVQALRGLAGWFDDSTGALSDRAAFIGQRLDAIKDPETRERATILCEKVAELAHSGRLHLLLGALQEMTTAPPAVQPTAPPHQHPQPQTGDVHARRA